MPTDEEIMAEVRRWMALGGIGGHLEGKFAEAVIGAIRCLLGKYREQWRAAERVEERA